MATRFQATYVRSFWFGIGLAIITDFVAIFLIAALILTGPNEPALVPALWIIGGLYLLQIVYAVWAAARAIVVYKLFEKEARVQGFLDEFKAKGYPRPAEFYSDAIDYLSSVGADRKAKDQARLSAASLVGAIDCLSIQNRPILRYFAVMSLESAIARYEASFGERPRPADEHD